MQLTLTFLTIPALSFSPEISCLKMQTKLNCCDLRRYKAQNNHRYMLEVVCMSFNIYIRTESIYACIEY